jgi:uncharacterized repeat protein (TIGR03803 family)
MKPRISGLLAIAAFAVATGQSRAANLTTLVSFNDADGAHPAAVLIADADGNLFGTTFEGGAGNEGGTVFEIAKTSGGYASTPTVLVSFCTLANCADGTHPAGGLIADAEGNLFGTTQQGGAHGDGTVFEIRKTRRGYAGTPTILVSFCSLANCADGALPFAGLIADAEGNLFGTTALGGTNKGGTVFEIAKTHRGYASTPTTLVSFCSLANCADGSVPSGGLIADADGNLFGTTAGGGAGNNGGTVFEIAKTHRGYAGTPTTLVSFCSLANCADGAVPLAALLADADGNLFGTTANGGAGNNGGTVFEIAKTHRGYAGTPTTLVSFCLLANCADGRVLQAALIADANGNLFGTTNLGGANGNGTSNGGTVFEITKTARSYASTPTTLVSFCSLANCADGSVPGGGLIADADGNLLGTTNQFGPNGNGTVFEITDSGFVVPPIFAGTPGKPNCFGRSVSALARQYGGLNAAAAALGYPGVRALQEAIMEFCEG